MLLPEQRTSVITEQIIVNDGFPAVHVKFDEIENYEANVAGFSAIVLADTLPVVSDKFMNDAENGVREIRGYPRLVTLVVRFPRCVLSEVNTHRVFSRNSASSRAKSVKVTIAEVMNEPYIPIFTENQKGMTGEIVDLSVQKEAEIHWLKARDSAVASVLSLLLGRHIDANYVRETWSDLADEYYETIYTSDEKPGHALNLHKQNVNRLLEPFMWHEAVITSTEWENFFNLREHDEADPAIHALALLMKVALDNSQPTIQAIHAPFARHLVPNENKSYDSFNSYEALKTAIRAMDYSSGAAAQVSYRPVVGGEGKGADPSSLAKRLLIMEHMSPFEHSAISRSWSEDIGLQGFSKSNLSDYWHQYRNLIPVFEKPKIKEELDKVEPLDV